jgi:hypothetical protein
MSRKHYVPLARIAGETLAEAYAAGGEDLRTRVYDALYRPLVTLLADDNPRFSPLRFAEATARAESARLDAESARAEADGTDGFRLRDGSYLRDHLTD